MAYYVVASRLNSISNNDINNNSWEYKLNEGVNLPIGTEIQVINSYINKQGITNNSIEINEDIEENFEIGFTVPQTCMWQQKPERTAKDDRLETSELEDPSGSLGIQTPEISIPLTNYYDCMVQHNPVHSDGMNIFNNSISTNIIKSITANEAELIILVEGDHSNIIGKNIPVIFKDVIKNNPAGIPFPNGIQADICMFYSTVLSSVYIDPANETQIVLTSLGYVLTSENGDYSSNNTTGSGGLFFPQIINPIYSQCSGLAFNNSLIGTRDDGGTLYRQTRLGNPSTAFEGGLCVPMLAGQNGNINYQAGITSDIVCEEFRSNCADATRDVVWNTSQTGTSEYQFDRGSYSFLFGPATLNYSNEKIDAFPSTEIDVLDFENHKYGPLGHGIRMNSNGLMITPTGKNNARHDYVSGLSTSKFYPYIDSIPMTEYPDRRDLSVPKPGQPAKYKDYNSPQVDYLRNGFSYDKSPMRCEIFTQHGMSMIQTLGNQNPFVPYTYQGRQEGVSEYQTNLSDITSTTFLDRVLLSQSMVAGLIQREDSYPYVKRVVEIQVQNIIDDERKELRAGDIIVGSINQNLQSAGVINNLFPSRKFRGELDNASESFNYVYNTEKIEISVMIVSVTNEGTTSATITELQPISNLNLTGATITNFIHIRNNRTNVNLLDSNVESFSDFLPYTTTEFGDSELKIIVNSENWENQTPQYIPVFSAKGCFSDLNGDNENNSTAYNINLPGDETCRMNYFIDGMHDQTQIDYLKSVGEDYDLNPNYEINLNDWVGPGKGRVCSHPYFNWEATDSGLREDFSKDKRILIQQRGNSKYGGIHPQRVFKNPITNSEGLLNSLQNFNQIPVANYLFGSTRHCSLGSMRPPTDRQFKNGSQVVMSEPLNAQSEPVVANNGLENFSTVLQNFDPDNANNSLKIKVIEERASRTILEGIYPIRINDVEANRDQKDPFGNLNFEHNPNCSSALGDYETYPYSTPEIDILDTGGTNSPLCLVQLQAIEENFELCRNDYVLRPLTSSINVSIPKGVYSIQGFLDNFNSQIKNIDVNDTEQLSSLNNFKTIRRFSTLNGLAITGGQVSLLSDFLEETHNRTIYSEDETSEFMSNPLVIAIKTQDYNDLVQAWQSTGNALGVATWLKPGEISHNSKITSQNLNILGGSYVWYNFRDLNYWSEFVNKYTDSIENIITDTEQDEITNYDTQFYFSKNRNRDDGVGTAFTYNDRATLGIGDGGQAPTLNSSTDGQYKITGNVEAKIDKLRNFNPVKNIYVGAPNFQLSYNSDKNLFSFSDLHFSFRNPTVDLIGESAYPSNAIDQSAVLYRTLSELITGDYEINGTDYNPPDYIKNALESPQDNISGVFIFNMSKSVALSEGDFIDDNSVLIGRKYNDYFTNNKNAKIAWQKTLWQRLGFNYETFNSVENNVLSSYYLNPVDDIENTENALNLQSEYFKEEYSDIYKTVKNRERQALCALLTDGSPFNNISRAVENNYLPGITTGSLFDIEAIPQIASSPGTTEGTTTQQVRLYNNASISKTRSMSGGYVYYPLRLGTLDNFNGNINYTGMNVSSPGEGFVYNTPRGTTCLITNKSNEPIVDADQLIYNRPYQFQTSAVPLIFPTGFYRQTYSQLVDGDNYPVAYEMDNFSYERFNAFSLPQESQFNLSNGVFRDRDFNLAGSMFLATQSTPILAESNSINANNLAILTNQGFFIITSDLISSDSIKGSDNLGVMGTIPISSLSSQDFITAFEGMPHVLNQETIINSIKIKILNPDLTNPTLQPDSTIIIQITPPAGTPLLNLPTKKPNTGEENQKRELVGEIS